MARLLNIFFCRLNDSTILSYESSFFTFMDVCLTILSIASFLADIGTDIIVVIQYYINGHIMWMLLTTILVCIPSLVVQIFSIRWYIIDGTVTNSLWIIHVFQLGVFQRYIKLLSLALKVRRNGTQDNLRKFHQQQSDICMLRLFESFTESAPQLVLQLYIMVSTDQWNPWTGISAVASLFSLSWGIAAYSKAMRNIRPEKKRLSWWGLLFQSLWRIGMVSSRVFAMVIFAAAYGSWLILAMAVHWLCMTIWVFSQKTDFCATWWEERLYNCVVGVIYCFCYFNIKEGQSRFRMSLYYSLTILQSLGFLVAFYAIERTSEGLKFFMMLLVPIGIVIGLMSMILYYRFFHPSSPITCFNQKIKFTSEDTSKDYQCNCCTLKTCRKNVNGNMNFRWRETSQPLSTDFIDHLENRDSSRISINSISENTILCAPDLHRSHSLNCSYASYEMFDSSFKGIQNRKFSANHHRNINYHFRLAANNGILSSKVHCSCLVLTKEINIKNDLVRPHIKHCNSLPNLDRSFDSETSKIIESSFISDIVDHNCAYKNFEQKPTVIEQVDDLLVVNTQLTLMVQNSKSLKSIENTDGDVSKTAELSFITRDNLSHSSTQTISVNEQKCYSTDDISNTTLNNKQSKSLPNIETLHCSNTVNSNKLSSFINCNIKNSNSQNPLVETSNKVENLPIINKEHVIRITI